MFLFSFLFFVHHKKDKNVDNDFSKNQIKIMALNILEYFEFNVLFCFVLNFFIFN
jgi:hypothetical protein